MKPISLHIAGLQSYRELQKIDFASLCDAGVFGIFGPTGSGKSSILDAMTLALYGKVERASAGTQGIMNAAENALTVSFVFELAGADGGERYRVDRQYKRGSDISVNSTVIRILRLSEAGESVVLADKARDVDQKVLEILGLSMEDFTRAVVLPQGKFAEFLSLKGSDRRKMLQRLFHLEAYGDGLNKKLKSRWEAADMGLKQLQAEQQGLGAASKEALDEAKDGLVLAQEQAQRIRKQLQECQREYEERKTVMRLQEEKAQHERQQAQLAEREPHIRLQEERLRRAEQAERLRPYSEALESARKSLAEHSARLETAVAQAAAARESCEAARAANEAAYSELAANEAPLLVRLEQLQQALGLQQEQRRLADEAAGLQAEAGQVEARLQQARAELRAESGRKEAALRKQAALKEQLKAVEAPAELRQKLQAAYNDARSLAAYVQQGAELAHELEAQREAAARLGAAEAAGLQAQRALQERLAAALLQARAQHGALGAAERLAAQAQAALPRLLERERGLRLARHSAELAAQLAQQLAAGEPCPVCGSAEHPAPARPGAAGADAPDDAPARLEALAEETRELAYAARHKRERLDRLQRELQAALPEFAAQEAAAAAEPDAPLAATPEQLDTRASTLAPADAHASAAEPDAPLAPAPAALPDAANLVEQAKTMLHKVESPLGELERGLAELLKQLAQLERQHHKNAAHREAAQAALAAVEQKHAGLMHTIDSLQTQWRRSYEPIASLDTIEALYIQQRQSEEQAEDLRKRIDISVPYIEKIAAAIEERQKTISEEEKREIALQSDLKGKGDQLDAATELLKQRIGNSSAESLISEAQNRLDLLKSGERQARAAFEEAGHKLHQLEQQVSGEKQAVASCRKQLSENSGKWEEALASTSFAALEEVKAAMLPKHEAKAAAEETADHRSREKEINIKLLRVNEQLNGRAITPEEWAAAEARLAEAKQLDEANLQTKAKAERDLEDVEARHGQWNRLEEKKTALLVLHERLGKLQTVFRGSAFVEFMAEEQLMQVSRAASERLGQLTRQRYALEVDSGGGFVIRDDANGGVRRPVTTLSGGETFLTSLALALALSAQIQLKGIYPLQFFFLDEGFGTLDQDLLETVITALEKLHMDKLTVGVISHVPELKARLPRKLIVHPAEPSGSGSRIVMEGM